MPTEPEKFILTLKGQLDPNRGSIISYGRVRVLILLLVILLIRLALLNRPFLANDEGTATAIPVIHAVNIARYGPIQPRFAGILNTGYVEPANWAIYAHHPPLVPLLIAAIYALFGISEWSTRIIPALFSIGTTILLYLITARRFGDRAAVLATVFYALAPATIAFGAMPDYVNGQVVFFILATTESYLRWTETSRRSWLLLMIAAFSLGALSDWPIFYLVPLLACHYWLTHDQSFTRTATLIMPGACLLIALFLWAYWASADTWNWQSESIFHQIKRRTFQFSDDQHGSIAPARWLRTVVLHNVAWLHTWPIFLLTIGYLGTLVARLVHRDWKFFRRHDMALLLLMVGLLHLGIAIQGTFQHSWWSVILTPGLALAAGLSAEDLAKYLPGFRRSRLVILILIVGAFLSCSIPVAYLKMAEEPLVDPKPSQDEISHGYFDRYTARDLGAVIKAVSRTEEGVVTSASKVDPTLWFYADRQLRVEIQEVAQLKNSLRAGPYPLPYWYPQSNGPRPRWFVVPPPHRKLFSALTNELDTLFPRQEINGYAVYRLY